MVSARALTIGVVLDRLDATRGGAEGYLTRLLKELGVRGHRARVYCMQAGSATDGAHRVTVGVDAWSRAGRERQFAERAVQAARRDGCDVVYAIRHVLEADLYQPHGGSWAATMAARCRVARFPWLHERWQRWSPKHRYFLHADRAVFAGPRPPLTLAVSELVRDDLWTRYGDLEPDVRVVPPAVDLQRFRPDRTGVADWRARHQLPADAPVVLFVAHEFRLKGLAEALQAWQRTRVRTEGGVLAIVGRGPVARYRERAARLGILHSLRFLGAIPDPELAFRSVQLLLHPTHHDPCALVSLEALATGLPVVTTRQNGAAPQVLAGGGAVVPSAFDVAALAEAMERLVDAPPAVEVCRGSVADLGWPQHVLLMEQYLQEAASRRDRT